MSAVARIAAAIAGAVSPSEGSTSASGAGGLQVAPRLEHTSFSLYWKDVLHVDTEVGENHAAIFEAHGRQGLEGHGSWAHATVFHWRTWG